MFRFLIPIVGFLFFDLVAFAEGVDPKNQEAEPAHGSTTPKASDDEDSQFIRMSQTGNINLGMGLRQAKSHASGSAGGVEFEYFYRPNQIISFRALAVTSTIKEKSIGKIDGDQLYFIGIETESFGSSYGIHSKTFFGNSFYVSLGMSYETMKGKFRISKDILNANRDQSYDLGSYSVISGDIRIGNQWQWKSFTIGTDWLGTIVPLANSYNFHENEVSQRNSVQDFRGMRKQRQTILLNFYIGYGF